jgi:hypothetical protein
MTNAVARTSNDKINIEPQSNNTSNVSNDTNPIYGEKFDTEVRIKRDCIGDYVVRRI